MVVSFHAFAWVHKDNDPEYVCAYRRKICTTKVLLKLNLKATKHHFHEVVGKDESKAEKVEEVEDALVILDGICLIPSISLSGGFVLSHLL